MEFFVRFLVPLLILILGNFLGFLCLSRLKRLDSALLHPRDISFIDRFMLYGRFTVCAALKRWEEWNAQKGNS